MVKYQIGKDLVQVSMKFPRALWKKLRLRALHDDKTATEIIVHLVEEHLSKKPAKKRESK